MGRVFISHNHIDDPFVSKLVSVLEDNKVEAFVDHLNIHPGEHWPSRVQEELQTCDRMIAVISDYSVASRNCTDEWDYFLDWRGQPRKEIFPVRLSGNNTYFRLASFHYVDFRGGDDGKSFGQLLKRLSGADAATTAASAAIPPAATADPHQPLRAALGVRFPLLRRPEKCIGLATGNIAEIPGVDVLVNSENNRLNMDEASVDPVVSKRTISAAIHSYSAQWNDRGELVDDTIDDELKAALQMLSLSLPVPLTTVIETSAGSLANIGVRRILHAVTVSGTRDRIVGTRPGTPLQLTRCVANALARIDALNKRTYRDKPLKKVILPIFGTGDGGLPFEVVAPGIVQRAIEHLEFEITEIETVYFAAHKQKRLDALTTMLGTNPELGEPIQT